MHSRAASIVLGSAVLVATGSVGAQEDPKVARAIEDLGSESPAARASARTTIRELGKPALDVLRRSISAPDDDSFAEQLFATAEELGRQRRSIRFTLSRDLGEKGWQVAWR